MDKIQNTIHPRIRESLVLDPKNIIANSQVKLSTAQGKNSGFFLFGRIGNRGLIDRRRSLLKAGMI